ncbi:hypothetical protein ACTWQB_13690 [Piscibacillus sp. B03]|uniref:hypothetical protein n=1 Tax=Piscibacillus sp. B03 TaxID=3457430 RepID=UPI003FCD7E9D
MSEFLKKHKNVIIVMAVLVIILAFILYRLFINSAIDYIEVEGNTIQTILGQTVDYTEDERELSKRLSNNTYEQEIILSGNVNLGEFSQTSVLARALLANSRVVVNSQHDSKKGEMSADINFQLQRTNLMKAKVYQDPLYTAVKLPLDPKPVGIKNDRLGEWMSSHYDQEVISEVPRQINGAMDLNVFDYVKLFQILQEIDTKKESGVSYKDNVYQKVTMNISPEQTEILKAYLTDQLEQVESQVNERLRSYINQIRFPEGITYDAYYNKEFVRYREFRGKYEYEGKEYDFAVDVDSKINGEQYQVNLDAHLENDKKPIQVVYQSLGLPETERYKVNRQITIHHNQQSTIDWVTEYRQGSKDITFNLNLPMYFPRVEGNLNIKTNINKGEGYKSYRGNLTLGRVKTSVDVTRDIKFTDDPQIEKINAQDVRFLDQLTRDEYEQWFNRFQLNFKDYINQIIRKFNPF